MYNNNLYNNPHRTWDSARSCLWYQSFVTKGAHGLVGGIKVYWIGKVSPFFLSLQHEGRGLDLCANVLSLMIQFTRDPETLPSQESKPFLLVGKYVHTYSYNSLMHLCMKFVGGFVYIYNVLCMMDYLDI